MLDQDVRPGGLVSNASGNDPLLALVIDQLPVAVMIRDALDGSRVVAMNQQGEMILGLPRERLLGRQLREVCTALTAERLLAEDRETIARGVARECNEELPDPSGGGSRGYRALRVPLPGADGQLRFVLVSLQDLTDAKQAQQALTHQQGRLRALLNGVPELVFRVDGAGVVLDCSDSCADQLWTTRDDLVGKALSDLLPADVAAEIVARVRGVLSTGLLQSFQTEFPVGTELGKFDVRIVTSGISEATIIATDISERQRILEDLRESHERLMLATESAEIGCWDWDIRRDILTWDPVMFRLYGINAGDFAGAYAAWDACVHPEDKIEAGARIQGCLTSGQPLDMSFRVVRPDGNVRHIQACGRAFRGQDGKAIRLIGCNWDVTTRVEAEAVLRSAKTQAEDGARAKSEFLAMMSHEIRTPMNGVLGFANLLLDSQLTQEQQEFAETIQKSGQALLAIINDILDFSKIEAGKMSVEMQSFDIGTAAEEVRELLSANAQAKKLELQVEIVPGARRILSGDPGRVRQVMLNLVGNAIKFTDAGRVQVTVAPDPQQPRHRTLIEVLDSGIGIPREKITALFQQFSQVDSSSARRFGGTGLGLAISRRLVELMGGTIGVESEPGVGSTFWFTLTAAAEQVISIAARGGAHPDAHAVLGEGRRLLLAEDNSTNVLLARRLLERMGFRVDVAGNGREAVEMAARLPYDVILMDCHMPEMDGLEATAAIRRGESKTRRVPIIALTANAMAGDRERCIAVGMDDYLTKPIQREELARVLETWLVVKA